jgi:hypothetical protein
MSAYKNNQNKREEVHHLKSRFQELLGLCQDEIKKTTAIGIKMLNATASTTKLQESYQELGQLTYKAIKDGRLEWSDATLKVLIEQIEECQKRLDFFEDELQKIKKSQKRQD